jgi:hypothetical protein
VIGDGVAREPPNEAFLELILAGDQAALYSYSSWRLRRLQAAIAFLAGRRRRIVPRAVTGPMSRNSGAPRAADRVQRPVAHRDRVRRRGAAHAAAASAMAGAETERMPCGPGSYSGSGTASGSRKAGNTDDHRENTFSVR